MAYPNLRAEMARVGLSAKEMAKKVDLKYDTLINKLNCKTEFTWYEICKIHQILFPEIDVSTLFLRENDTA